MGYNCESTEIVNSYKIVNITEYSQKKCEFTHNIGNSEKSVSSQIGQNHKRNYNNENYFQTSPRGQYGYMIIINVPKMVEIVANKHKVIKKHVFIVKFVPNESSILCPKNAVKLVWQN